MFIDSVNSQRTDTCTTDQKVPKAEQILNKYMINYFWKGDFFKNKLFISKILDL